MINLARVPSTSLAILALLGIGAPAARAQDSVPPGAEPVVASIDVAALKYDYLVDVALPKDEPAKKQFTTLQSAYAAAPAGTKDKPTVIGIKPGVHAITGSMQPVPSLRIEKDNITLLGLTNNRRAVVLADNRGLRQGADDNGYIIDVAADGFTAKNLTIINYCNCDYEYPGDPTKNLKRRSDVITQGVALQAAGDRHVYENVALLGRLDTMFLRATRSYFKHCYVEGTDDWMGGGQASVWEDCTLVYPETKGVMSASGVVFIRCKFEATEGMQFYKPEFRSAERPVALIECTLPASSPEAPVAWFRGVATPRRAQLSLTYHCKDTAGKPALIYGGSVFPQNTVCSRELTEAEARAFNPWNLLRAAPRAPVAAQGPLGAFGEVNAAATPAPAPAPDEWDPAGVREKYKNDGDLPTRVLLTGGEQAIRTGGGGASFTATVAPARADQAVAWSTESKLVTLSAATGPAIIITGKNTGEKPEWAAVKAAAANGIFAEAYVYVAPQFVDAPVFRKPPTLSNPKSGSMTVDYSLQLEGRDDHSLVTWFVCDDAAGKNARKVAMSRGGDPAETLTLTPGMIGKYIEVMVQPRFSISDPGPEKHAFSAKPVAASDVPSRDINPQFVNFATDVNDTYAAGMWTVIGTWNVVPADPAPGGLPAPPPVIPLTKLHNGYGIRPSGPGFLVYQSDADTGDMKIDLTVGAEKLYTVFSVPGSPDDEGPDNLHGDIFIKYDPRTSTGYSLRFWRTAQSAKKCMFQFYKITNGKGTPLSDKQVLTGIMEQRTTMTIKAEGSKLSVGADKAGNGESLWIEEAMTPNRFGGAGVFYPRGSTIIISRFAISTGGQAAPASK